MNVEWKKERFKCIYFIKLHDQKRIQLNCQRLVFRLACFRGKAVNKTDLLNYSISFCCTQIRINAQAHIQSESRANQSEIMNKMKYIIKISLKKDGRQTIEAGQTQRIPQKYTMNDNILAIQMGFNGILELFSLSPSLYRAKRGLNSDGVFCRNFVFLKYNMRTQIIYHEKMYCDYIISAFNFICFHFWLNWHSSVSRNKSNK